MFGGFNFNMNYCSNPFSMGCMNMNPRLNFFMGLAAGTSGLPMMPMYGMPMGCSLFSNQAFMMPSMNYSSTSLFQYNNFNMGMGSFSPMAFMPAYIPRLTFTPPMPSFIANGFGANLNFNFEHQGVSESQEAGAGPEGTRLQRDKNLYGPEFLNKVKQVAKRINCNYRDLLGVMNSESGIRADAKNPNGSATGLIQFMESTARGLGTTTAALRQMTPIQQLDYVEKFFVKNKAAAGFGANDKLTAGDLYALTFLPARAKREELTSSGENYYNSNRGLDTNKDGKITKSELAQRVRSCYVSDSSFLA